MQAPLTARLELEVLHGVRQVDLIARHTCRLECLVQDAPGWPHERTTEKVFLVTRLFADEHEVRGRRAFTKHGLCRSLP